MNLKDQERSLPFPILHCILNKKNYIYLDTVKLWNEFCIRKFRSLTKKKGGGGGN